MLISAEGTPFELFESIVTQQDARKAGGTTAGHINMSSSSSSQRSMTLQQHGFSSSSGSSSSSGGSDEVVVDDQLGFAKDRTISRLTEMQSIEYLLQHAKQRPELKHLVLALQEAQDKQRQQH
jgi:predicted ATPase